MTIQPETAKKIAYPALALAAAAALSACSQQQEYPQTLGGDVPALQQ